MARDKTQPRLFDLFQNGLFNIPSYQRAYSWEEQQVTDLLDDIGYLHQDRIEFTREKDEGEQYDKFHYFGNIVVQRTGEQKVGRSNIDEYDVIDGQQRLTSIAVFVHAINKVLRELRDDGTLSDPDLQSEVDHMIEDNRELILEKRGHHRLVPDDRNRSFFIDLIVQGQRPTDLQPETPAQHRLLEARETFLEWIGKKRNAVESPEEFIVYLDELCTTLYDYVIVTKFEVESTSEAGRFFVVLNDRGKDLTTIEKIKGYLIYCADRQGNQPLADEVYRRIGEVVEQITEVGDEDLIDRFVREHWRAFTGEYNYDSGSDLTEIHRRIKTLDMHAPRERDKIGQEEWVRAYMESMSSCAGYFQELENPDVAREKLSNQGKPELGDTIAHEMKRFNVGAGRTSRNLLPLLLGARQNFGLSKEYLIVLRLCTSLVFRLYTILGERVDKRRSHLRKLGYPLLWAGREDEVNAIFGPGHESARSAKPFPDSDSAFTGITERLDSMIGESCPDYLIWEYLTQDNILEGNSEINWNGMGTSDVLYLLYEYEWYLTTADNPSPRYTYDEIGLFGSSDRKVQLEHIWPQSPRDLDQDLEEAHEDYVNSLGNLLMISVDSNLTASNKSYADKYPEYMKSKAKFQQFNQLPDPKDIGWGPQQIESRTEQLVDFVLHWWGGLSEAHVTVRNYDDLSSEMRSKVDSQLRNEIRRYCVEDRDRYPVSVSVGGNSLEGEGWRGYNFCCETVDVTATLYNDELSFECSRCGDLFESVPYSLRERSTEVFLSS